MSFLQYLDDPDSAAKKAKMDGSTKGGMVKAGHLPNAPHVMFTGFTVLLAKSLSQVSTTSPSHSHPLPPTSPSHPTVPDQPSNLPSLHPPSHKSVCAFSAKAIIACCFIYMGILYSASYMWLYIYKIYAQCWGWRVYGLVCLF